LGRIYKRRQEKDVKLQSFILALYLNILLKKGYRENKFFKIRTLLGPKEVRIPKQSLIGLSKSVMLNF
jgi:hypothetical protein